MLMKLASDLYIPDRCFFFHIIETTTRDVIKNEVSTIKTTAPNPTISNAVSTLSSPQNKSKYADCCCSAVLICRVGLAAECFPALLQKITSLPSHPSTHHQIRQRFGNLDWILNVLSIHSHRAKANKDKVE